MLKQQNVLRSAMLLTASGIIAKSIDFLFRAYYSRKLGSEGMGIFSLVFAIHSIMLTFATGGLGVAVSKTVSELYAHRRSDNIRKTMRISIGSVCVLSIFVIFTTALFADQIAEKILKEPRCAQSLIFLSPSILFMGISYCIKGYFYASRKVLRPASSEFLEQAVKITAITKLLGMWLPKGIHHGCEAVFLGLSIGEFSSCFYLFILYIADTRLMPGKSSSKGLASSIARIALPVTASSLASSALRMQEDVWIVSSLRKFGLAQADALSGYGIIHGMVMPLIVFPLTLMSSFLTLLVPEISRADGMRSKIRLQTLTARIYRFTVFFSFLVLCVLFIFADELSLFVYGVPKSAPTLRMLSLLCPIMFIDSVSCGILNGLGKQSSLLKYSISDSVLRLAMIYILIPKFGINALIFIIIASNIYTFSLTVGKVSTSVQSVFIGGKYLFRPAFAALLTFFTVHSIFTMTVRTVTQFSVAIGIIFSAIVYFAASAANGALSKSDIAWLFKRLMS